MKPPDWGNFVFAESVLREAAVERDRLVVWCSGELTDGFRHWERVASVAGAEITAVQGLCSMPANLLRTRQKVRGLLGRLFGRSAQTAEPTWTLPTGQPTEQVGDRQSDLILAWTENGEPTDEERIRKRWPGERRVQRLGRNLFLVAGVEAPKATLLPDGNPGEQAEQLLAAARRTGDRRALALALTDSAIVATKNGAAQQAVTYLQEALAIARQLEDRGLENDALGNLGMALLALGEGSQALEVIGQQLRSAREANDRYEQRIALSNLGALYAGLRDHAQAISAHEQALRLAREIGDVKSEWNTLWSLAIQLAELGEPERAIALGQECVTLLRKSGDPLADDFAGYLHKYRLNRQTDRPEERAALPDYSSAVQVGTGLSPTAQVTEQATSGPGLLRMAWSAAKAMGMFLGTGFKTAPAAVQQKRLLTCSTCEHHTGMRCRVCGCFTKAKTWLPHERCPLGKW